MISDPAESPLAWEHLKTGLLAQLPRLKTDTLPFKETDPALYYCLEVLRIDAMISDISSGRMMREIFFHQVSQAIAWNVPETSDCAVAKAHLYQIKERLFDE